MPFDNKNSVGDLSEDQSAAVKQKETIARVQAVLTSFLQKSILATLQTNLTSGSKILSNEAQTKTVGLTFNSPTTGSDLPIDDLKNTNSSKL
jgi:hypothetical protein